MSLTCFVFSHLLSLFCGCFSLGMSLWDHKEIVPFACTLTVFTRAGIYALLIIYSKGPLTTSLGGQF